METITKAEAARILNLSRTWVDKLAKKGELRQDDKGRLFKIDVSHYAEERRIGSSRDVMRELRNSLQLMTEEKN